MPTSVPACTEVPQGGALPSGVAAGAPMVDCAAGEYEADGEALAVGQVGVDAGDAGADEAHRPTP